MATGTVKNPYKIESSTVDISTAAISVNNVVNNYLKKCGRVVVMGLALNSTTSMAGGTWIKLGNIPSDFASADYWIGSCMCYDDTVKNGEAQIRNNAGVIEMQLPQAHANSSNKLIRAQLVWLV